MQPKTITLFEQLNLKPTIQAALAKIGYSSATPIQAKVISSLINEDKQDLIALAQTGSGKTAAFGIPLAEKLDATKDKVQALVLTPTRELAAQVHESLNQILPAVELRSLAIYGGTSYTQQRAKLKKSPHVIIATPGRLVDLVNQKQIDLTDLKVLVLDEADRMLSMGFEEDLQFILDATHNVDVDDSSAGGRASCQTWLFSATMGPGIKRILHRYLSEPVMINQVDANQGVSATLEHLYLAVRGGQRSQALLRILSSVENFYGIVFCQTKKEVQDVEDILRANRIDCMSIHGDKLQRDREHILRQLKDGKFSVLVATDVAARGIDVKSLKHVVHYSLPNEIESYIHRSGRTGRNGESGKVISILESSDFSKLNRLVRTTKIDVKPFKTTSGEELMQKFVEKELSQVNATVRKHPLYHKVMFTTEAYLEKKSNNQSAAEWIATFLIQKMNRTDQFSDAFIIADFSLDSKSRPSGGGRVEGGRGRPRPSGGGGGVHSGGGRFGGPRKFDRPRAAASGSGNDRWSRERTPRAGAGAGGPPPTRGVGGKSAEVHGGSASGRIKSGAG